MMWRCPHCSTPQPEASRCWVCHRSSTSCGTCRQFRQSVAARVGYCALDRRRRPLDGDEVRACWEDAAQPLTPEPAIPGMLGLLADAGGVKESTAPAAFAATSRRSVVAAPRARTPAESGREWVELEA